MNSPIATSLRQQIAQGILQGQRVEEFVQMISNIVNPLINGEENVNDFNACIDVLESFDTNQVEEIYRDAIVGYHQVITEEDGAVNNGADDHEEPAA